MAKLYRHPEGGGFYDAFGGKIGEVEEIYMGDSFDRSVVTACASVDGVLATQCINAEPATLSSTVKNCDWNADALASLAGISGENTVSFNATAIQKVASVETTSCLCFSTRTVIPE